VYRIRHTAHPQEGYRSHPYLYLYPLTTDHISRGRSAMEGEGVLQSLDKARTQVYHFTAILIAGMGFLTDAYNLFVISGVTELLGRITTTTRRVTCPERCPRM